MKTGRPRKSKINWRNFEFACRLMATKEEILSDINASRTLKDQISEATFSRRIEERYSDTFEGVLKRFSSSAKVSLRRLQFKAAEKGNVSMLIWLGKNCLDQVDTKEITIPDADQYFQKIADAIKQSDTDTDSLLQRQTSIRN